MATSATKGTREQLLSHTVINSFSFEWQETLILPDARSPLPLTSTWQCGTRCQHGNCIGIKLTMCTALGEKDPQEFTQALNSAPKAAVFVDNAGRSSRLQQLAMQLHEIKKPNLIPTLLLHISEHQ